MSSTTPKNMLKATNINHHSNRLKICSSGVWDMLTVLCNDFNCLLAARFFKNRSFVTVKQFLTIPLLLVQANPFCLHEFAHVLNLSCKWQRDLCSSVSWVIQLRILSQVSSVLQHAFEDHARSIFHCMWALHLITRSVERAWVVSTFYILWIKAVTNVGAWTSESLISRVYNEYNS